VYEEGSQSGSQLEPRRPPPCQGEAHGKGEEGSSAGDTAGGGGGRHATVVQVIDLALRQPSLPIRSGSGILAAGGNGGSQMGGAGLDLGLVDVDLDLGEEDDLIVEPDPELALVKDPKKAKHERLEAAAGGLEGLAKSRKAEEDGGSLEKAGNGEEEEEEGGAEIAYVEIRTVRCARFPSGRALLNIAYLAKSSSSLDCRVRSGIGPRRPPDAPRYGTFHMSCCCCCCCRRLGPSSRLCCLHVVLLCDLATSLPHGLGGLG
jgi:hypothetical protein